MVVCICRGVRETEVIAAIEDGANCLDTLELRGIGGDCFGCQDTLRQMLTDCSNGGLCSSCRVSQPQPAYA